MPRPLPFRFLHQIFVSAGDFFWPILVFFFIFLHPCRYVSNLVKMPHGDVSDAAAFFCLGAGVASIFKPALWFETFGPLKPFFDGPATPQVLDWRECCFLRLH